MYAPVDLFSLAGPPKVQQDLGLCLLVPQLILDLILQSTVTSQATAALFACLVAMSSINSQPSWLTEACDTLVILLFLLPPPPPPSSSSSSSSSSSVSSSGLGHVLGTHVLGCTDAFGFVHWTM